jgi:phospholipase/carboxylesterase
MSSARLSAHPGPVRGEVPTAGTHPLALGGRRDGVLVVPPALPAGPVPLVVALHGAGGTGLQMADLVGARAAGRGLPVLAPDSRSSTWDVIGGGYGPDVAFLDEALASVFAMLPVASVAVAGFSDGASYALSIGVANGDLFSNVLAWSPGFLAPPAAVGRPRVYVSHGTGDRVLPIDRCSRRLVPELQRAGYEVTYEEFDGGHVVPPDVLERSLDRLMLIA